MIVRLGPWTRVARLGSGISGQWNLLPGGRPCDALRVSEEPGGKGSPLTTAMRANEGKLSPEHWRFDPPPKVLQDPTEQVACRSPSPEQQQQVAQTTQKPSPAPDGSAPGAQVSPSPHPPLWAPELGGGGESLGQRKSMI